MHSAMKPIFLITWWANCSLRRTRPTGQTGSGQSNVTNAYLSVGGPVTSTTFYDQSDTLVRQVTRTYGLEGESLASTGIWP